MVAVDQYGNGQPVQYLLIETNSDWHMAKCMDHVKRANEQWRLVRIVIVDKDMRDIDIIRKKLPEAHVLLCHFHVIKWVHETIRKSKKYGVYEEDVLSPMKHIITNMTYARTSETYTSHCDEFKRFADREDLPELLKVLLAYQRQKEEEYMVKVEMPGTFRDVSYCEQMNIALDMTTRWVAAAIKTQYDVATDALIADYYAFKDNDTTITVQYDEHEWFDQRRLSQDELTEVEQPFVANVFKKKQRAVDGALSVAEKYRRAQKAFDRISGELAQVQDEVFESAMSDLDKSWYNLRHGKTDLLPPPSSGDGGSGSGGGGGGNDGGAPGGSASQGEGPQEDHHVDNAEEGSMQDEDGSDDGAPTQVVDSTTQAADNEGNPLATLQVKSHGQGKPIEWRVDAAFVPDTVRFRLLESIVDNALEQFLGGLAKNEQIELDSEGEAATSGDCYVAAIAKAFAVVLASYNNNVTITATPQRHGEATQQKRSRKGLLSSNALEDVVAGVSTYAFVLLPVIFGGTHWVCLVVDRDAKQVKTYDSKNDKRNKQMLKKIASEKIAADATMASYTTVEMTEPLQPDSNSCGVLCVASSGPVLATTLQVM
ncbi:hypothetical protein PHYSODRAFT_321746 [Phytophthora sojae]|uniref:Ubiquitin-like protease family profile domain-containing protein n=1 Tax=Phytophthora sojae (strain P6497) TaxID=1094619 RepID=G4YG00_PHYSP|nr:hypothetical protein PHYSODRAFT_321746 [Phytophthora sojae]EGZ28048.1 hypothetical protein PHYSODRAFT_321746 [Phytophthora sojae]|eukprot:XP_009515323.1 hypothetical protein PHYSODRAFT_321746 [Phytophthora sojae]